MRATLSCRHVGSHKRKLEGADSSSLSPLALTALPQTSNVQASNTMNGAAMILLKKCDGGDSLTSRQSKRRRSSTPGGQANGINSSEIKSEKPMVSLLAFVEDFMKEHSALRGQCDSTEPPGSF